MAEGIVPVGNRFLATCPGRCERPLHWTVDTAEHATNLRNKHLREHHADVAPTTTPDPAPEQLATEDHLTPGPLDLTAAARAVVDLDHAAATAVWAALTNTSPTAARSLALGLAESDTTVTAHAAPF